MVKRPEGVKGFVLLPKRWVVGRSFAWVTRLRRLARDLERLPSVFVGLHWAVFGVLMLAKLMRGVVTAIFFFVENNAPKYLTKV